MLSLALPPQALQVVAAAASICLQPLAPATPEAIAARVAVCMQDLRAPESQKHTSATAALGALGQPALAPLGQCIRDERDDAIRARCARALGLTKLEAAQEQLLTLAARDDLQESTVGELSIALSSPGSIRALPLLARFVRGDDPTSRSAATALFLIGPTYYQRLPESSQTAYAIAIADAGWLKTQHAQSFLVHAPDLAKILIKRMRSGQLELSGKKVVSGRWFLMLGRLGRVDDAPQVVALAQSLAGESAHSAALDVLAEWRSPLGLGIAVTVLREGLSQNQEKHSLAWSSAGRYLRTLANQEDPTARQAIGALWRASEGRNGVRCELVGAFSSMTPTPPASEVAALLASPCAHDITVLLDHPDRGLIDGLVAFLRRAPADVEPVRLAREALAWQCAERLRNPMCQKAAPLLRGVQRPVEK